ncbi:MAG: hypothetical protein KDB07_05975 [Planctomycetes bacterium]|nr:hypothetical protein [Planctomycetota bacterium]
MLHAILLVVAGGCCFFVYAPPTYRLVGGIVLIAATVVATAIQFYFFLYPRKRKPTFEELEEQEFLEWVKLHQLDLVRTDYELVRTLEPLGVFGKFRPNFRGAVGKREGVRFWIGNLVVFDDGFGGNTSALLNDMVALFRIPYRFEDQLVIEPKRVKHTLLREVFNLPIARFESYAFNQEYIAFSHTPSFAHAAVTPMVMEQLLTWPNTEILLTSGLLFVSATDNDCLSRHGAEHLMAVADAFLKALPAHIKAGPSDVG